MGFPRNEATGLSMILGRRGEWGGRRGRRWGSRLQAQSRPKCGRGCEGLRARSRTTDPIGDQAPMWVGLGGAESPKPDTTKPLRGKKGGGGGGCKPKAGPRSNRPSRSVTQRTANNEPDRLLWIEHKKVVALSAHRLKSKQTSDLEVLT
jgi:hypothetical protein